jgi:uncharacterized membrane-anchored protein
VAAAAAQQLEQSREKLTPAQLEAQLQYREGRILLRNGLATIDLPDDLRYLDPAQTNLVMEARGNPSDTLTLGMLVASDASPVSGNTWVALIDYWEGATYRRTRPRVWIPTRCSPWRSSRPDRPVGAGRAAATR